MSTKVLSKTYIRSYIHAYYQEGLVDLLQQASFDSWLDYPTILQLEMVLRTRVHYSPLNTLPRIHLRLPTEEPSSALTLILRLLTVSIYLSMNCIGNQVVLYHGRDYSNSSITLQGCTSSHTLPPLIAVYTTCTRQPSSGSPTWVSATAYLNTQVSS